MSHPANPSRQHRKSGKTRKRQWLAIAATAIALTGHSQDSLLLRNYDYVESTNAWLSSGNGAALTQWDGRNITQAELSGTRGHGGLTDYSGSPDELQADVEIASYLHLTPRTVVYGQMSYNNFSGKDMGGSVFINPQRKPFDIEEDSLTTLGKKHRDTYHLAGGVGIDLYHGLSVGLRMDYTAANYAKYKDLRHKNKLMDMTVSAGVFAPLNKVVSVGAHYAYRRNTESVTFSLYGREDKIYKSFINYGTFIGEVEQFGNSGFTDRSREMPMVDDYNGVGFQLGIDLGSISWANEFTMSKREGYYGRKSPYTITFSNHESNVYEYRSKLKWQCSNTTHILDLKISAENLTNEFETYREKTNESGAYYYEYYDAVKTANKVWVDGKASYSLHWGLHDEQPTWTIKASYDWAHRKQTAYRYPYYRRQTIDNHELSLECTRNIFMRKGILTLKGLFSFLEGEGAPYDDLTFVETSDKQTPPPTMDTWMMREYRWLTAPQYKIGGSIGYALMMPGTRMATYAQLRASHQKANATNEQCIGNDRTTVSIAIGTTF